MPIKSKINRIKKTESLIKSVDSDHQQQQHQQQQHQIKLLKQIVKTIEEKSLKEKNLLQKQLNKKKQECEALKNQLSEVKIIERNLRNELKQLANEVRLFKQQHR